MRKDGIEAAANSYNGGMPDKLEKPKLLPPMCAVFRRYLKGQGLKFTPERAAVLDAVLEKAEVFEADELLGELRGQGRRVSKATVYRTLKHLLDAQIICEVLIDSRHAHYQRCIGQEPTGHLVCVQTHEVVEFDAPELEALRDRICAQHNYDPVSYHVVVYGTSPQARKMKRDGKARGSLAAGFSSDGR